ncbi:MAG: histidine kinase [Saprospiraceae bacterium]|nr:histidine kinase [Saprospiraceae bacterium]
MSRPNKQYWVVAIALLYSTFCFGQFHKKTFDIAKQITFLDQAKDGSIYYATASGEIGIYNGIQFTILHSLQTKIRSIDKSESFQYALTSNGLIKFNGDRTRQISRNNLDILAKSMDNSFLVTTSGVYDKINSEYTPTKGIFYNINEITRGDYFSLLDSDIFRVDNKIYQSKNSWKEFFIHTEEDFNLMPWSSNEMILSDRNAVMKLKSDSTVDTLLNLKTNEPTKVFKLEGSKILVCANDSLRILNVRNKLTEFVDGVNTALIQDIAIDGWGNIWVATDSYLYQFIDKSDTKRNDPPKVEIESVKVNGLEIQSEDTSIRLQQDDNEIEIDYSGVQMTYPQNLQFQTSFIRSNQSNKDVEWIPSTRRTSVEYRNVKPGKYTFQLRASIDGEYFTYTKPIDFFVESNMFQSLWLIAIACVLVILFVALFFNNRYTLLKEKSARDRNRLIQENKMLLLQQKALQLQMNPHFVFNALNSIQGLIANQENQKARRYLQEFSSMMRNVLNQSRSETIVLEDEISYLKSYLKLEQMANNDSFDWHISAELGIEDGIRIPTMIIQPFIENAIIHGVKPLKERRGKIDVKFSVKHSILECRVQDNGIGREAASKLKKTKHKSVAIEVAKDRLQPKLKSVNQSPIQYKDLLDSENKIIGTVVLISIPTLN